MLDIFTQDDVDSVREALKGIMADPTARVRATYTRPADAALNGPAGVASHPPVSRPVNFFRGGRSLQTEKDEIGTRQYLALAEEFAVPPLTPAAGDYITDGADTWAVIEAQPGELGGTLIYWLFRCRSVS